MNITADQVMAANAAGLRHRSTGDYWSYHTAVLQAAYDLGQMGHQLTGEIVSGYRYGVAPSSGVSINHAGQRSEYGLSLAGLDGEAAVGSVVWFADRPIHHYAGIISPRRGSDGEPVILPLHVACMD